MASSMDDAMEGGHGIAHGRHMISSTMASTMDDATDGPINVQHCSPGGYLEIL